MLRALRHAPAARAFAARRALASPAILTWGDGTDGQLGHYPFSTSGLMKQRRARAEDAEEPPRRGRGGAVAVTRRRRGARPRLVYVRASAGFTRARVGGVLSRVRASTGFSVAKGISN